MKLIKFIPLVAILCLFGCNNDSSIDTNKNNDVDNNDNSNNNDSSSSETTSKAELINNWTYSSGTEFNSEENRNKLLQTFNTSYEGLVTNFESENLYSNPNDADGSFEKPYRMTLGSQKATGTLKFNFSKSIKKITTIASGYTKYTYTSSETTNLSVTLGDAINSAITSPNVDSTFIVNFVNGSTTAIFSTRNDGTVSGYRAFIKSIVVEW